MKRNIIVSSCLKLSIEDKIQFIEKCYKAWAVFPVKDVDLVVETKFELGARTLQNTNEEKIYGMIENNIPVKNICIFVRNELHCAHYLIARIRNGKVKELYHIK